MLFCFRVQSHQGIVSLGRELSCIGLQGQPREHHDRIKALWELGILKLVKYAMGEGRVPGFVGKEKLATWLDPVGALCLLLNECFGLITSHADQKTCREAQG